MARGAPGGRGCPWEERQGKVEVEWRFGHEGACVHAENRAGDGFGHIERVYSFTGIITHQKYGTPMHEYRCDTRMADVDPRVITRRYDIDDKDKYSYACEVNILEHIKHREPRHIMTEIIDVAGTSGA